MGTRGTTTRGTAVFGGDLVVKGTLFVNVLRKSNGDLINFDSISYSPPPVDSIFLDPPPTTSTAADITFKCNSS